MGENSGELTAHLTSGAAAVYAIEFLKSRNWFPWMTQDTKMLNRIVSFVLATASVIGISWSYDPSLGGDVHIPGVQILLGGAWEVCKQMMAQQVIFDGVVGPASRKEVTVQLQSGATVSLPVPKGEEAKP